MNIPANLQSIKVTDRQNVADIVRLLLECELDSRPYYPQLKRKFQDSSEYETAKNIMQYMNDNFHYVKESAHFQTGKTIGRILKDRYGDCKMFATFSLCCLKACGIRANFRCASYDKYDKIPTHIYTVAYCDGRKTIVDGVLKRLDKEANYQYAYDVKPVKA